jgi:hypothetical protein
MLATQAIERAYRQAAIKRIGASFTSDEYNEGLDHLNGFIDSLFGAEIGEQLTDVQVPLIQRTTNDPNANFNQGFPSNLTNIDQPIGAVEDTSVDQYVLAPNSRVLNRITTPQTVFFPQNPQDGARISIVNTGATATMTLDGNGRRIDGANTASFLSSGTQITYFYRADLGEWKPITQLTLTDTLPLPAEFDRLLICGTAISLTALDEINPTQGTMFIYNRLLARAKERYYQRVATTSGGQYLVGSDQAHEYNMEPRRW